MEREVTEMIKYAFILGRRTEAEIREAVVVTLDGLEPVTDSTH